MARKGRIRRSQVEIEELCLKAIREKMTLKHITYVRIAPYTGPEKWTWEIIEVWAGKSALSDAMDEIRELQGTYDLV